MSTNNDDFQRTEPGSKAAPDLNRYYDEIAASFSDPNWEPPVTDPTLKALMIGLSEISRLCFQVYGQARFVHDQNLANQIGPMAFRPASPEENK